jgi:alkanesulfonate monooxygenase SsuD/methylene tetrahydromethanopterin reductase-like flavin-dependent oxidoreductase (luciferase family)
MTEALEIMRRLLDGEKLTYEGKFYVTDRARLYSPPIGSVPILLAAGGPKSAALAGELAQGVITSVKDPAETMEKVVDPLMTAASDHDRPRPTVLATRWSIVADDDEEAWRAIYPWRGLRAPGRLEAVDPADLREMADGLPREEILERYSRVSTGAEIIDTYLPLVDDLGADIVAFQMAALDQPGLIEMLGKEVLPELRR